MLRLGEPDGDRDLLRPDGLLRAEDGLRVVDERAEGQWAPCTDCLRLLAAMPLLSRSSRPHARFGDVAGEELDHPSPLNWTLWLSLTAGGVVVMALPDSGPRLFSISEAHGPSALDAVGIALVLVASSMLLRRIWSGRARLRSRSAPLAAALLAGAALTAWSILGDHGAWWVAGVALLAGVQLLAAVLAERPADEGR